MEKDEILEIESMLSKLTNSMDILNYTTISSLAPDRCCLRIFFMEASMRPVITMKARKQCYNARTEHLPAINERDSLWI